MNLSINLLDHLIILGIDKKKGKTNNKILDLDMHIIKNKD
jgi:hypothetical protein